MRIILLALFTFFQLSVLAQQHLTIKTNPLYLLDSKKHTMPVGLEYSVGNFGIQLGQMLLLSKKTSDGFITHQNYNKTNIQLRYYIDEIILKDLKLFVGVHGTRRVHDYWVSSGSYVSAGGLDISHRGSLVEAKDYGAYYILGTRMDISPKLALEFVSGFGFRELSIQHNPESFTIVDDLYSTFLNEREREGTRTLFAVLGQIRVNYRLF